ncbi:MAG: hypothetical protein KGO51_16625 [Alphaproteobacteria bacterium]|nr:hypothetical protein [Alphaproteobacteria bacterium]
MRLLVITAALAVAGPALAQAPPAPPVYYPSGQVMPQAAAIAQYQSMLVQQEQLRQQAIQQQNDLYRLEAQMGADKAVADIQAQRRAPPLRPPDVSGPPPYAQIDTSQLPTISDKALAESDKRVLDASRPRD